MQCTLRKVWKLGMQQVSWGHSAVRTKEGLEVRNAAGELGARCSAHQGEAKEKSRQRRVWDAFTENDFFSVRWD